MSASGTSCRWVACIGPHELQEFQLCFAPYMRMIAAADLSLHLPQVPNPPIANTEKHLGGATGGGRHHCP